ncbi:MAG: hypothetical protein V4550_10390 [Gemmatimonadota bacterium]
MTARTRVSHNTLGMNVGKSVLLGPAGKQWATALRALPEWSRYSVHVPGRRACLNFAKLHAPRVIVVGTRDRSGIPTLPLLSRLQLVAPQCQLVCLHDESVVALPSVWSIPVERTPHHVFLVARSHGEASIAAWRLVRSLLDSPEEFVKASAHGRAPTF